MIPTDKDLNEAMARALGWRSDGTWNGKGVPSEQNWYDPKQERTAPSVKPNDYCNDRNTLPEILDAVEAAGKQWPMATRLDKDLTKGVVESAWIMWRLPMRAVVTAALQALGAWPKEWSEDE